LAGREPAESSRIVTGPIEFPVFVVAARLDLRCAAALGPGVAHVLSCTLLEPAATMGGLDRVGVCWHGLALCSGRRASSGWSAARRRDCRCDIPGLPRPTRTRGPP